MSYVTMKSEDLIPCCEKAIEHIKEMCLAYQFRVLRNYVKKKNSGIKGWFRKIFNCQYTHVRAFEELNENWDSHYYRAGNWYWDHEIREFENLVEIAKSFPTVNVSKEDYISLNRTLSEAEAFGRMGYLRI